MASKRKEVLSSPQRQAKKVKRDPLADKLNNQLREVSVALNLAPITPEVEKMIGSVLQLSLGEFTDQRHRFQTQVIEAIASILGEAETALKKEVVDARSQRDSAIAEKALREKDSEEAAAKLKVAVDKVYQFKVVLGEKALAFRAATRSLAEAEEAKKVDGKQAQEAEKKRNQFELGLENLTFLKACLPEDVEARQKGDALIALLKKHKFEESLMTALPAALEKAPDARGQFDLMTMTELENELTKLVAGQKEILVAAAPSQEKCEAVVRKQQDHLAAVRSEQRLAARDFDVASEEQASCETVASETQKALRELSQLSKRLVTSLNNAEVEVELFEQGPRETFKELCQRSTPEPTAEEPTAEEPVAMVDEQIAHAVEMEAPMVV